MTILISDDADDLLSRAIEVAREAGAIAQAYFRPGGATTARTWSKAGGSPVTEADVAVDTFLKIRLSALRPDAAWLSEETADDSRRLDHDLVWIVDPIDGTRAFLSGDPDWAVAVALLASGQPVLGIVYAPAHDVLYEAATGKGAMRNGATMSVSARATVAGSSVAGPKPFVDQLEHRTGRVVRLPRIPSLALRIARVAEGSVDVGLVTANARDWDIVAADLILAESGGLLMRLDGVAPVYNQRDPVHRELAAAPVRLRNEILAAIGATQDGAGAEGGRA